MIPLRRVYAERVAISDRSDYLYQVGHTIGGISIKDNEFLAMCDQLSKALDLTLGDDLLDLCCGNGLFTNRLAGQVKSVTGVDFCPELISIAQTDHVSSNVEYHILDVRALSQIGPNFRAKFSKVLLYAGLQHLDSAELDHLLADLHELTTSSASVLLGLVPDSKRKRKLYSTPRQKFDYLVRKYRGRDQFGTWWDRDVLHDICQRRGWSCSFLRIPADIDASRYRFDAILTRQVAG